MREIKFRAWDKQIQKMLDIDLPQAFHRDWERFAPMQYTGLKDKNGKEIYEGDIVEWDLDKSGAKDRTVMKIEYDGGGFHSTPYINATSEIIGNIFENPELLAKQ